MALDGFIGQISAKDQIRSLVDVSRRTGGLLPHLLLSGAAEMGKVTLARTMAEELGFATSVFLTTDSKPLDLAGLVSRLNFHDVVILEEIQNLRGDVYVLAEQLLAKGSMDIAIGTGPGARTVTLPASPFTFVATSSRPWQIPSSLRRWFVPVEFSPYSVEEIAKILRGLAEANGLDFQPEAARLSASYCDGKPGNACALLRRIQSHYGQMVSGVQIDEDLARYVLSLLGYDYDQNANVGLADRLRAMSGTAFEEFVAGLFRNLGYVIQLTPGSGDHGVDILIRKAGKRGAVQCKRWNEPVGEPVLRDFLGSMLSAGATVGYVAATTTFTDQAQAFAHKHSIQLLDLEALLGMAGTGPETPPCSSLFS